MSVPTCEMPLGSNQIPVPSVTQDRKIDASHFKACSLQKMGCTGWQSKSAEMLPWLKQTGCSPSMSHSREEFGPKLAYPLLQWFGEKHLVRWGVGGARSSPASSCGDGDVVLDVILHRSLEHWATHRGGPAGAEAFRVTGTCTPQERLFWLQNAFFSLFSLPWKILKQMSGETK